MSIIFTQEWDIIPGREEGYEDFLSEKCMAEWGRLGLESVGGFYVEVGEGPRIISLKSAESFESLYKAMSDKSFLALIDELKGYVINYRSRVLQPTGRVKRDKYEIQKGVWKYNQYYNLVPGRQKEYADFIVGEHLPTMAKIDYVEVTGGWKSVIGGAREIIAELTFKTPVDIGRLLDNEDFRRITQKLRRNYVSNYTSRIMRTTERFEEPRWYRL
ncbi:MAG: hypothetical protein BWK80_59985 [Desulfobacteraceae bacterium IS3]|nr:MAG: hypothetical protein BWK80_59985 [Desulfobacteraceae bacterium IS3]